MKRSRKDIEARRHALTEYIRDQGYRSVSELARRFEVSEVTMRRDLIALEEESSVTRTHGGAVVNESLRFSVFGMRVGVNQHLKRAIARQAVKRLKPGMRIYMDAGTTIYAVAQEVKRIGLQDISIMTPSIPVAELFAETEGVQIALTGGNVLARQSCLVGELSEVSITQWDFDIALLGAEGIDDMGLWNSDEGLVRQHRILIRHVNQVVYCLDPTKSTLSGPIFVCRWDPQFILISGA